jgi:hypothetical protein
VLVSLPATAAAAPALQEELEDRLRSELASLRHERHVVRFFRSRPRLLAEPGPARVLRRHAARLLRAERRVTALGAAIRARERRAARLRAAARERARARRLAAARRSETPRETICRVFGPHCRDAIAVARCESRLRTGARNGQYLGLFQMGALARSLFGHGGSADAQARAAHRYFVQAGRSWHPWTCKP